MNSVCGYRVSICLKLTEYFFVLQRWFNNWIFPSIQILCVKFKIQSSKFKVQSFIDKAQVSTVTYKHTNYWISLKYLNGIVPIGSTACQHQAQDPRTAVLNGVPKCDPALTTYWSIGAKSLLCMRLVRTTPIWFLMQPQARCLRS